MSHLLDSAYGKDLIEKEYLRERLKPLPRDVNFLHLKDNLDLLKSLQQHFRGRVLDYGCGGAPYSDLFRGCDYVRADIVAAQTVDIVLTADGMTGEPAESFDTVVSTQVLEHVPDPEAYFRECIRVLKPGGQLVLVTHGMFQEHGCPFDFYRWTCNGLEALARRTGFEIEESGKITTELRAFVQLLNQLFIHLRFPGNAMVHYLLAIPRKLYFALVMPLLNVLADRVQSQSKVSASDPASLYVGVYLRARRPSGS